MKKFLSFLLGLLLCAGPLFADIKSDLETILAVGEEGSGNEAAGKAWQSVVSSDDPDGFHKVLEAVGDNQLAVNWLISAAAVLAEKKPPGSETLTRIILDTDLDPKAREFALDLLISSDEKASKKLIPHLRNDPAEAVRRVAVQSFINAARKSAEAGRKKQAAGQYREVLEFARDVDQVKEIASKLEEFGEEVDLPKQFGFLMRWNVLGPFDNTERSGFASVYPPEEKIDLAASYPGKDGAEVAWKQLETADAFGMVDFNKPYGMLKEVAGYAYTEFDSPEEQEVEIRLGCKNAWKVWVNGELVFARDEYHRGMRIDQYKLKTKFKKGLNSILVKCCQNEQKERWTVEWQFQMRVCDHTGTAVLAANRGPTPKADKSEPRKPDEA